MNPPKQPTFLVSAYSEPVVVRINGKANYLNCNDFREFIETMLRDGSSQFVLDFEGCTGMDSTFLGILAGTALELRKQPTPGVLVLCQLSERNYELICNLGLQNLLTIAEDLPEGSNKSTTEFSGLQNVEVSDARNVLKAHENLVKADDQNAAKFQDVIAFLRNQVEDENGS
ncbi:STAS domain-containing protein [Coraliomargarita parva]|uniref:STAS domain-containing protein n=1 Tax=Coraliomargarita parva TaxID=3014050 RepID=UPI0022B55E0C|nr:STAS domain-containing protein [Coraliomargarita parva]